MMWRWAEVMQVYDKVTYLQFARDDGGCHLLICFKVQMCNISD